jgi:hypothetical protein
LRYLSASLKADRCINIEPEQFKEKVSKKKKTGRLMYFRVGGCPSTVAAKYSDQLQVGPNPGLAVFYFTSSTLPANGTESEGLFRVKKPSYGRKSLSDHVGGC